MKLIPIRDDAPFKTLDVLQAVVSQPTPGQGINADEMRRRCRLLDALEKADTDALLLEDADHELLVRLINDFQFGTAHPKLLAVIDAVVQSKEPETAAAAASEALRDATSSSVAA